MQNLYQGLKYYWRNYAVYTLLFEDYRFFRFFCRPHFGLRLKFGRVGKSFRAYGEQIENGFGYFSRMAIFNRHSNYFL